MAQLQGNALEYYNALMNAIGQTYKRYTQQMQEAVSGNMARRGLSQSGLYGQEMSEHTAPIAESQSISEANALARAWALQQQQDQMYQWQQAQEKARLQQGSQMDWMTTQAAMGDYGDSLMNTHEDRWDEFLKANRPKPYVPAYTLDPSHYGIIPQFQNAVSSWVNSPAYAQTQFQQNFGSPHNPWTGLKVPATYANPYYNESYTLPADEPG